MKVKGHLSKLATILGIIVFAFIIYKIGPKQIWENIQQVSLKNFLILIIVRIVYWLLRTYCWKVVLDEYEGKSAFYPLFVARMVGHAVSQLSPTAQVGSEATRIFMVKDKNRRISVASVIIDKTIESITVVFFTIIGVATVLMRIKLSTNIKVVMIGGVTLATIFVALLFFKQKEGILTWIADALAKIKIRPKILVKNRDKFKEVDEHISEFYQHHRMAFLNVSLLYSLLIAVWVIEIYLTVVFLGVTDISLIDCFLVTTLGNLAFLFPFIPGSLGVYEATYIVLFALIGRSSHVAFTLVLIRRLIATLLASLGILGVFEKRKEQKKKPTNFTNEHE